jgi:hypothetical protein
MQVTGYFEKFTDAQFLQDVAAVFGGYLACSGVAALENRFIERDVPDEAYGAAVIVGAEFAPIVKGRAKRHVQVGGGLHMAQSLGARFGVE